MHLTRYTLSLFFLSGSFLTVTAQSVNTGQLDGRQNTITTAVPFLMITPDARTGALGDAGVALPNDLNANHWNAAKLPFNEKKGAVAISYTPWLRQLVPDVSMSYLSAYYQLNKRSAFGTSLRYFSLGNIQFTDFQGLSLGDYNPNELAFDLSYAQKLSDEFAVAVAFRYIYSNLAGGYAQSQIKAGTSYAADITAYYRNDAKVQGYKMHYGIGAAITNIGSKVTYTTAQAENFIPVNLRLGGYSELELDKYNTLAVLLDFNKLLVPTPPVYKRTATGQPVIDPATNQPVIESGKRPDQPLVRGMIQSFTDAPGGITEELHEINISGGLEYWYDKQFALRAGYFHEHATKGNRKYMTMGAGIRYNVFGLDAAYLFSFGQRNPLDQTLRFTLTFDFEAFASQKEGENKGTGGVFPAPGN
jgi:hypothetical protein